MSGIFAGRVEPKAKPDSPRQTPPVASAFAALMPTYASVEPV